MKAGSYHVILMLTKDGLVTMIHIETCKCAAGLVVYMPLLGMRELCWNNFGNNDWIKESKNYSGILMQFQGIIGIKMIFQIEIL